MTSAGSCYGFDVRSSLPMRFLREGPGAVPLRVDAAMLAGNHADDELLVHWEPDSEVVVDMKLWSDGRTFRLWINGAGWYEIDPAEPRITVPEDEDPIRREQRLWAMPSILCMLPRGDFGVHAASVQIGERAVLLAAPGRYGKTTLAAAFVHAGHRLLSEDTSCVRLSPVPSIVPGPALLRVRHDVAVALEPVGAHRIAESSDRVHFALDEDRRGDCEPVPLAAIVMLHKRQESLIVERAETKDILRDLWWLTFSLPDPGSGARCFADLADLVGRVPSWRLHRPLTIPGLAATIERIEALVAGDG